MKVLFLFGGPSRRMKASGTRQKIMIGGKRLWKIQSAIAEKNGLTPIFCTNEITKNGPKNIFEPANTIAESIINFLRQEQEEFVIVRGDTIVHPSLWQHTSFKPISGNKLGGRVIDEVLTTVGYNIGNTWSSLWRIRPEDYQLFIGSDWQLLNKICDYRDIQCVEAAEQDFIEIDSYSDVERAEWLLKKWNV